jgi:uncharacterized protein YyaL (SSP411 family)
MIAHFSAPKARIYDTTDDHEALITRPRDLQENATPSGNAIAPTALLRLAGFTNELHYVDDAHQVLAQIQPIMAQYPLGFGQWLQAGAYTFSKPREIAIVDASNAVDTETLLGVIREGCRPFQAVALGSGDGVTAADGVGSITTVPLQQDRVLVDG